MTSQLILGRTGRTKRAVGFTAALSAQQETGDLITYAGDGHLMTFAPTGAGKSSGPVITNALTHKGQLIVIDIKGEIHAATAQARRDMGQEVHVLDVRDNNAVPGSLNPLDLLMLTGTDPSAIAHGFAGELVERSEGEKDRFWSDWAEVLIAGGLATMLADTPPEKRTLSQMFELFNNESINYKLAIMLDDKELVKERSARTAFASYLQVSGDITQSSIMASTQTHLRLFDSDMIRRLTDTSSMDVEALVAGEPMSLYIIVPPLRLRAYRPILRVWLSSLILAMTQRANPPKERTLMLCDEMGNLGQVEALLTAATLMRSFGLTLWTYWQNLAQLQVYGSQANTLIDNAGVLQIFGLRNHRAAQDAANIVGGVSPEQIMNLKADEQLLLIEGKRTICKQARYYSDELFLTSARPKQ